MQKKVYAEVKKRSGGLCEICKSNYLVETHHVIHGKGNGLMLESHKGNAGVHGKNGHELDIKLKRQLQNKYLSMGYTENQVREMMGGKLY